jgi:large subunit ribosomal protein L1
VHVSIGRISFDSQKLVNNARAIVDAVIKAKPSTSKGKYVKRLHVSSTMGPSVGIDVNSVTAVK